MAALPSYVKYGWRDMAEQPESVVEAAPMERGIPKHRRTNSDARVDLPLTLHLDTHADIESFLTWFYTTINAGADFFDLVHPRTGATVQARFKSGQLGAWNYLNRTLGRASMQVQLEYWRSAWA